MSNENNKMQVDIENLFKQNVYDLSAIKELYRKLKEVDDKILQIKYVNSTLANKLKKEYEKLKRIILDENASAALSNEIETVNENLSNEIETVNENLSNEIETVNENLINEIETVNENLSNEIETVIETINSQLDTITHQRLTTITPQMFGCVGDGFTDDTKGLQDAINYCIANDSMLSSDGGKKYLVSSTININGNLNINFNMATITTNNSDIGAILKFNDTGDRQCEITNLKINCNRLAITGIQIDLLKRKFFNNIEITLCLGCGFKIISGYEIFINKSYIMAPADTPNNAYGIYITTHDCCFTDIIMRDVKTGVYSNGSNFFTRVHPWILSKEVILGSVCFYIGNTTFMSDCYGDSYETIFYINGYITLNLTNFKTYYNPKCYLGDTLGGSKPILFKFPNSDIDGSCIKAYGCYFDGAKGCYSDNSYGSFSNINNFKDDIITNNDIRYWTNKPIKATVTEELVALEDNFTATYNRIVKDRNGDFAVLELQTKYTGTIEGGVDTKICSLPKGVEAYRPKQILCSISTNQWERESICYGYLTNDGISVKLPQTMTDPYIVVDVIYRLK